MIIWFNSYNLVEMTITIGFLKREHCPKNKLTTRFIIFK